MSPVPVFINYVILEAILWILMHNLTGQVDRWGTGKKGESFICDPAHRVIPAVSVFPFPEATAVTYSISTYNML